MLQNEKVMGVKGDRITIPAGITNAVYMRGLHYQTSVLIRLVSGGTLFIIGASNGQTYAAAQPLPGSTLAGATIAAIWATFAYHVGASGTESVVEIQGPAAFYLGSDGGTATVSLLRMLSQQGDPVP